MCLINIKGHIISAQLPWQRQPISPRKCADGIISYSVVSGVEASVVGAVSDDAGASVKIVAMEK
jgi:hypothetical protein